MSDRKSRVSSLQQGAVSAARPRAKVISKPAKDTTKSILSAILKQIPQDELFIDNKYREEVTECTWLSARDSNITTLICDINISFRIDPQTTRELILNKTTNPDDIYWSLPSMIAIVEKYDLNVEAEFSVVQGTRMDQACPVCSSHMHYFNVRPPTSADEAAPSTPICAECYPRT